jgi:DNA (cytosine-5)-methyltransferase 3A
MKVLSLFDGMSCGQLALKKAGIKVDQYYASEIDKFAIKVTMANFPNTIQLGDVTKVNTKDLTGIDLLIGGSPCQSFSFAGKRKGMSTKDEQEILTLDHYLQLKREGYEFEGQSYLFWEYMRILHEVKPKYFFLENVIMSEKWERILSKAIGVNPIEINSSLVSAQNRRRLYWTNIGLKPSGLFGDLESIIEEPKDRGILLKDILQTEVDPKYYLSEKMLDYFQVNNQNQKENGNGFKFDPINDYEQKSKSITTKPSQRMDDNFIVASRGRNPENPKSRESGLNTEQQLEPRIDGKTNCLTSVQKDNLVAYGCDFRSNEILEKSPCLHGFEHGANGQLNKQLVKGGMIRRLTPLECERLQTVPDNYTNHVSNSQRYKMLGNGWTVDVIAYIFQYLSLPLSRS